jgi:hypothetical protein
VSVRTDNRASAYENTETGRAAHREGIAAAFFPELLAGGFSRLNTTVQFYTRLNALLTPEMAVLDFG